MNSFRYLLPQRRYRVWGLAGVTGATNPDSMRTTFAASLIDMASEAQISRDEIFCPAPEQSLQEGRHEELVAAAERLYGSGDLFVDVSTSKQRVIANCGGVPCTLPTHPVWSNRLHRYLNASDFLRSQGIFPESFKPEVWDTMVNTPGFGQDLAGNSFSSTVCQGVLLAAMCAAPTLWAPVGQDLLDQSSAPTLGHAAASAHGRPLVRVRAKSTRPEYDFALSEKKSSPKQQVQRVKKTLKKRKYHRKTPGFDSRLLSKGKKTMITVWNKLELLLGSMYIYIYLNTLYMCLLSRQSK